MNKAKKEGILLGIGWAYTEACVSLDNGEDIRKTLVPDLIKRAEVDFEMDTLDDVAQIEPWYKQPKDTPDALVQIKTFQQDLEALINHHSKENGSDTPDWILAEYLCHCLQAFDQSVIHREQFYERRTGEANTGSSD